MNETRTQFIMVLFVWIPYALVAWGFAQISHGSFFSTLGVLVAIRLFFSIIEFLGSILSWRLYGKKKAIERSLTLLRSNEFPKRQYADDDLLKYLVRIERDETCTLQIKSAAKQWEQALAFFEDSGILLGMRMHSAAEAALNIYSPKHEVTRFGDTTT